MKHYTIAFGQETREAVRKTHVLDESNVNHHRVIEPMLVVRRSVRWSRRAAAKSTPSAPDGQRWRD